MTSKRERIRQQLIVTPGQPAALADRDPAGRAAPDYAPLSDPSCTRRRRRVLARGVEDLADAQELLWASDTLLAAGGPPGDGRGRQGQRDRARHVRRQPAGRAGRLVQDSRRPRSSTTLPLAHRRARCRERGRIGIFNRSHYEEVVALRVHPEWLDAQRLPAEPRGGVLGAAVRGHQRLRASPRPQRDEGREVLPQRLEGRAEAALLRASRYARTRSGSSTRPT